MTDFDEPPDEESVPLPGGTRARRIAPDLVLLESIIPEAHLPEALTESEQDVALQAFRGATNEEIARARGASIKTVCNQLEAIYRKLGVASRVELVLLLRHGAMRRERS